MKRMTKSILLWCAALILVAVAVYFGVNKPGSGPAEQTPSATTRRALINTSDRETAPDFTLTDLSGNKVTLGSFRGKNVYINFWTTWCPWCKKELPDINQIAQEYHTKNTVALTVDIGEDKATVSSYIKDNGYSFNVLPDTTNAVADKYNISSIPVSVFVDQNGRIAQKTTGAMTYDQMKDTLDQLLNE